MVCKVLGYRELDSWDLPAGCLGPLVLVFVVEKFVHE